MNPNEIPAWLDQHGGADGPPQTDANGVTTHRARDGSYVTVFNGQVRMIGSPPMQGDEQAPAQPAQQRGVGMTQQELEAILGGFGTLGPGDFREEVKQEDVPNPAAYDENGQYIQGAPLTIKGPATYRTWVKPGTNIRLTVKVNPDGSYTQVYSGPDTAIKPEAQQNQRPHEEPNPADPTRIRRWNPQTNAWEDAGPNQPEIERRARQKEADDRAAADRNKPTVTIKEDGSGGFVSIQTYPDGRTPVVTPISGIRGTPQQITHGGVVYERGPDGTYKPAAGIPVPGQARKNIDAFTPDYSQPDLGLGAWSAQQRQKIGLPPDQGGITQDDYNAAAKEAHDQATVTLTNITNGQSVVRQQAIDNQTQSNRLSDQGAGDLKDARAIYDATWKYANPNSDARFSTIPYLLQEMQKMREARMGTQTPMPALHPMFTNLATAAGVKPPPGATTGTATPPPPTSVPPAVTGAAAAASGAAPPNAIGAGAVGNQPTPSAPPVRDDWRTQPNAPTPVSEQARDDWRTPPPAAPVESLTPGPDPQVPEGEWVGGRVLQPPAAPVEEQMPEQGPGMAHPAYPVEVQQPTNFNPNSEEIPPYNPGPGAAGHRPGEPVGVVPGPVNGWARLALAQPTGTVAVQPQMQQQNPALQQAAQGAQQPLFDPFNTAGRLAAMGVPLSAISAAMGEMGLLPEEAMA